MLRSAPSAARVPVRNENVDVCLNTHLATIAIGQVTIIKVSGQEHPTLFNGDILIVDEKPLPQCHDQDHILLYHTNGKYDSVMKSAISPNVLDQRLHLVRPGDPPPAVIIGRVVAWFRGDGE